MKAFLNLIRLEFILQILTVVQEFFCIKKNLDKKQIIVEN